MTRLFVAIGMCAAITAVAAAQTPKYGVSVNLAPKVDVAKFKTYSWTLGQPSADKAIDARVIAAVDRELASLGMTKAAQGPGDVLVAYYSLSRTDVDLKAKADAQGTRPQYSVGTLMVALLDPGSRERLLRLRIDKPIDIEPAKLEVQIDSAVAALFAKYPTRTKK